MDSTASTSRKPATRRPPAARKRKIEEVDCVAISDDDDDDDGDDDDETDDAKKQCKKELSFNELDESVAWRIQEVLADKLDVTVRVASNVIKLLDEGNTIPFIARYRQDQTNGMDARKLTDVADTYESLREIQHKVANVIKKVEQIKKMTPGLKNALVNAKTKDEVEFLYQPFKAGSKKTKAEAARALGLESLAMKIVDGVPYNMQNFVKSDVAGLKTVMDVQNGVTCILADIFSKNPEILDAMKKFLANSYNTNLESGQLKTRAKKTITKVENAQKALKTAEAHETSKFETYYNFSGPVKRIQPYQVLAINRGESLKVLSVRVAFPPQLKNHFEYLCWKNVKNQNQEQGHRRIVVEGSIEQSYKKLVEPLLTRNIRSELTKNAERASVEVFVKNLNQLLLTPPVRGKVVLGIDPGFKHGCKIAVISATGSILDTNVMYLGSMDRTPSFEKCRSMLKHLINKHRCEIVAIGNGTACRETEEVVSEIIKLEKFSDDIVYCIVNESGASIYSTTVEADAEMPDLHVNLRSAASIARRLQDPLAEYVKVDPKHLGVGMYQHDVTGALLKKALDRVVVECVSFVGVDVNTGSEALLRKVAGLNVSKAKNIIKWRTQNGPFVNREQLKSVTGLGPKSYEQCAGFVRILPSTSSSSSLSSCREVVIPKKATKAKAKKIAVCAKPNLLDTTCIHPESYKVTLRFLKNMNETLDNIGKPEFIGIVKRFVETKGLVNVAENLDISEATFGTIFKGLCQNLDYDMRSEFEKPLFRKGVNSMDQLNVGMTIQGRVGNIVDFGAFVDIGVGHDGLIHKSKMRNMELKLGDRVDVKIINIEPSRKRIGLLLEKITTNSGS